MGAAVLMVAAVSMVMHGRPAAATFPGANGPIVFQGARTGAGDIYAMNPDGSNQVRLTSDPSQDLTPAVSKDGTRIAFASERTGRSDIYIMNSDGSGVTQLTTSTDPDFSPTWNNLGTKIAFTRAPAAQSSDFSKYDVYVIDVATKVEQQLTTLGGLSPNWSPDGTKIAFASTRTGNFDVFTMSADGSGQTDLTPTSTKDDGEPSWSPDGSKLAFRSARDNTDEIYSMNADGTSPKRLTNDTAQDAVPAWSPDGTKIAFESDRNGNFDIFTMNADGTGITRLTTDVASDLTPAWSSGAAITPSSSTTTTAPTTTTTFVSTITTLRPAQTVAPVSQPLVTTTLAIMNSPYVAAGSSFGISGNGFLPSQQLQAFLFSTPMFLGTVVSDVNGNYQGLFNIPVNAPAGPHTVVVQGAGRSGGPNESVATIVVTAPGTQPAAGSYGYGVAGSSGVAAPTTSTTLPTTAVRSSTPAAAGSGRVAYTGSRLHYPLLAGSLFLVIGLYLSIAGYLRNDLLGRRAS